MSQAPCKLTDSFHFLGLKMSLPRLLGIFALRDVANIALNQTLALFCISVADHLHADRLPALRCERHVFVANIAVRTQLLKSDTRSLRILEEADFPECLLSE